MNITCLVCLLCPVSAAFAFPSLLLMSPVPARCQNILTFLPEITFFQIEWLRAEQNSGKTKIKTSKEIQLHIECTHNYKKVQFKEFSCWGYWVHLLLLYWFLQQDSILWKRNLLVYPEGYWQKKKHQIRQVSWS